MGHNVSHIIDTRQRDNVVNQDCANYEREVSSLQRSTSLEHIGDTLTKLAVFDINVSKVMMTRQ